MYACKQQPMTIPTIDTPDYKKGESLFDQHPDSAFYYFNKVATGSKDSLLIAKSYNYMAVIQSDAGDYYGSIESLLTSLKYLHEQAENNQNCLVSDYNELGRNSAQLNNYDAAIYYYDLAIKRSKRADYKAIALNNQAVTYQRMGKYAQAIAIYQSILEQSSKSTLDYARILSNLAKAKWLQDTNYNATPDLWKALCIRKDENDEWGLNASYAHLSDYYAHKNPDSSLYYAHQMYAVARHLNSPDDQLQALQKLIELSPSRSTKQYFTRYQSLNDSIQDTRNTAKNQFALIRYEAQKSKADNLKLQKENTDKKFEIIQQRALILGIIAAFIVAALWYRRRKQWETKSAIREHQLKTSQKVHDIVANGLYQVMTKVEHQGTIEIDQLLDDLEVLYEQSRDISYEQPKNTSIGFHDTIAALLGNFATETTKVLIVGNSGELWLHVPDQVKRELEVTLQELMINMKKHSSAGNVVIKFDRMDGQLVVQYTDDGIGFPIPLHQGNGLTSTGNRINGIGGQVIFDNNPPKGVIIKVYIPIGI
jgi:tetratricopeptide (TPR) repeat protein